MAGKIFIIAALALACSMPVAAQSKKQLQQRSTTMKSVFIKEGTPAYYEHTTRQLFKQGKWEQGRKVLEEGLKSYESLSTLNELMGSYWLHHKQYDKARYYLIRSLRDDKDNLQSKEMLLRVEELTKHYSSAIVYCNELLESSPYNLRLWKKKIELFRLQGNYAEASRQLARLREIFPESAEIKNEMVYDQENKFRKARTAGDLQKQEDALRELLQLDPKNEEFQMALCNLLLQTGRSEEALDVAGYAATLTANPYLFVEKKASILGELGRYNEALSYLKNAQANIPSLRARSGELTKLANSLEEDAARAALQNDPYTAYARIYEKDHSEEALTYLLNTSMSRGYLDDALVYIAEARKRHGDTKNLLSREYSIQRRLSNNRAANAILEKMHANWPDDQEINEDLCAVRLVEVRNMMDLGFFKEASAVLENIRTYSISDETKQSIEQRLFTCYVKTGERQKAIAQLNNLNIDINTKAALYEEVAVPYIRQLISEGKLHHANKEIQVALDMGNPSADILRMGINTSLQLRDGDKARSLVALGKKRYPDDPFFTLKDAQFMAENGEYDSARAVLRPLLDTYVGDSTVVNAYVESCEQLSLKYLKEKDTDRALALVDDAMQYRPTSQSLILTKAMIYKSRKEWDKAVAAYVQYHPSLAELKEYNRTLEAMRFHLLHNQVSIDYQLARPASEDQITSTALVAYTRYCKKDNYTLTLGYAGRDGLSQAIESNDDKGGTGVSISGEWEHEWNEKLTTNVIAGCANKFFPRLRLEGKASYVLPNEYTAKASVSYRLVSTYSSTSLIGLSAGGTKGIERFNFGADLHLFALVGTESDYFTGSFFCNLSAIAKCFPLDDSRTNIFLSASVGNAPELSLIDYNMPTRFNQLNTMLSIGGIYAINSFIDFGLTGSWYSMAVKSTSTDKPDSTKNYLYLNANVTIHF